MCCSQQEGYNLTDAEVSLALATHTAILTVPVNQFDLASTCMQVKQAIQLLDKNGDGLIQFSEFVDWWQNEARLHSHLAGEGFSLLVKRSNLQKCILVFKNVGDAGV